MPTIDISREGLTDGNSIETTRKKYLKLDSRMPAFLKKLHLAELNIAISGVFVCVGYILAGKEQWDQNFTSVENISYRYSFRVKDIFTLKFYLYIFQYLNQYSIIIL